MMDKIKTLGQGSIIQHGPLNDRIYLMKLKKEETSFIIDELNRLAQSMNYSKIFCKVPVSCSPLFLSNGYFQEAQIPRFFKNEEDAIMMSKFRDSDRIMGLEQSEMEALHQLLSTPLQEKQLKASRYSFRQLTKGDIRSICKVFSHTFESYPFPVYDPEYVTKTMDEDVIYFGAELNGNLVAIASSEMDRENLNAEMTDFATQKEHRGQQLATRLLRIMEKAMQEMGMKTLYTIARLPSIPMNKTFLRQGYKYTGTLIKNTHIGGQLESMNLLYKSL